MSCHDIVAQHCKHESLHSLGRMPFETGACLYIPMARPASLEKLPRNKEQTSRELMKDATRQKIEGTTGGHKNAQEKLHPKS